MGFFSLAFGPEPRCENVHPRPHNVPAGFSQSGVPGNSALYFPTSKVQAPFCFFTASASWDVVPYTVNSRQSWGNVRSLVAFWVWLQLCVFML